MLTAQAAPVRPRLSAGFSLIELFIAIGAMALVIFFTLGTFTVQHQTHVVVDQVAETQQNARSIAALIERDVRNAGFMVPPEAAVCGVDADNQADVLFVSDPGAIRTVDQLPTHLRPRELGATTSTTPALGLTALSVDDVVIDEEASYDTSGDGVSDSDFRVGAGAIAVDLANPDRGVACGFVRSVTPSASLGVEFLSVLWPTVGLPPDLRVVPAHAYQIIDAGGGVPPELQRNGVLTAKDVEDLQVAWFYDDDGDGQVGANEYRGVPGNAYAPAQVDGNDLREVRVNLVVRTRDDDPRNPDAASTGQSTENRTLNLAGDDGRRRRTHVSTVRVRNVAT